MKKVKAKVELPPKLIPIFAPERGSVRYRAARGGRGGAKSFSFALMAAVWGYKEPLRILCTREYQSSIKDSLHAEIKNAIMSKPWLAAAYDVGVDYIRGKNGTLFIFRGLRHNIAGIKSIAQIDLVILEECETVSESSWIDLEPTIRAPKSEIWAIWNGKKKGSAVDKRFVQHPPDNALIADIQYFDNPWFSKVLDDQRLRDKEIMSHSMYIHVWLGAYLKEDDSNVFCDKWKIEEFTPQRDWDGAYNGLDFGFSQDPTAGVKLWINEDYLYIEYEAMAVGLELDDTAEFLIKTIPGIEKHVIRADCARPESISYLKRNGLPRIIGCEKGKGSVEDGLAYMKSFKKIIIHPRCVKIIEEFEMYSYKVDRLSGDILPVLIDKYNHGIDACRYALEKIMKKRKIDYGKLL